MLAGWFNMRKARTIFTLPEGGESRATEVLFELVDDALLIANGGRHFTRKGVISVCASHLSDKRSYGVTDHFDAGDDQLVAAIRDIELDHYQDPNRISGDSGAEHETAHDYGGRFVWELLQNADDTMGKPGRSSSDLIGSKGLGFKAVLETTDEPEIYSGPFHFGFSVVRTRRLLRAKKLHDNPPPLTFRIAHECEPSRKVQELLDAGYATVIRLPFRDERARQMAIKRLRQLDPLFLLFSQELVRVRIRDRKGERVYEITRQKSGLADDFVELSTRDQNGSGGAGFPPGRRPPQTVSDLPWRFASQ